MQGFFRHTSVLRIPNPSHVFSVLVPNSDLKDTLSTASLYSGFLQVRYSFIKHAAISGRAEIYNDETGILSGTFPLTDSTLSGLQINGFSFGIDYYPADFAYVRLETR